MGNWTSLSCNVTPVPEGSSNATTVPKGIEKFNDHVWQLYRGDETDNPKVEIIFFHGLQLEDFENAFWKTWLSKPENGSAPVVWPQNWLGEKFCNARILAVSYNTFAKNKGQLDMTQLGENLVQDIITNHRRIGQDCPVVLVGHSLGGLVLKQFIISSVSKQSFYNPKTYQKDIDKISIFLGNLKGVFYYATPHQGSNIETLTKFIPDKSPILKLMKKVDTDPERTRINEKFRQIRKNLELPAYGMGESLPTQYKGSKSQDLLLVPAGSAASDVDVYIAVEDADHFNVCKPADMRSSIFSDLCDFIDEKAKPDIVEPLSHGLDKSLQDLKEQGTPATSPSNLPSSSSRGTSSYRVAVEK